jgi:hypothetical protein
MQISIPLYGVDRLATGKVTVEDTHHRRIRPVTGDMEVFEFFLLWEFSIIVPFEVPNYDSRIAS